MTDDQMFKRIEGRKWAEEALAAATAEGEDYRKAFVERIGRELAVKQIDEAAMSEDEAMAFGHRKLEFGKYAGQRWDDVPLDYIAWLVDQNRTVLRYLRSRRVQAERDHAD